MDIKYSKLDPTALNLIIEADIDTDAFEQFAAPLVESLDCDVVEQQWGADRHQWLLDFEGTRIWLHYEFYADTCWLHVEQAQDFDVLIYLSSLLPGDTLAMVH